jgi:hypothetical protein
MENTIKVSEIPVENSEAKWIRNANYENNWHLEMQVYKMGKSWMHDRTEHRIYGWIEEQTVGIDKGKFEASIPALFNEDDENSSDCQMLGCFDAVELAMSEILERNFPEYGMWV